MATHEWEWTADFSCSQHHSLKSPNARMDAAIAKKKSNPGCSLLEQEHNILNENPLLKPHLCRSMGTARRYKHFCKMLPPITF